MSKLAVYVAGPMTGYPDFNFPAFYAAEKRLKEQGYIVYNPANKEDEERLDPESRKTGDSAKAISGGFDFKSVYMWDLEHVVKADAIYVLKGWEKSAGACGELAVAKAIKRHYPEYQIMFEHELEGV